MPESTPRKKAASSQPVEKKSSAPATSPTWWAPLMVALMVLGLVWIVVFYVTEQRFPVPGIGLWNMAIGFGVAMAGFLMTTRWR